MVMTMASKQVTITVDEELLAWFEQKAAQTGGKLSPTIARAARNWMLWEDAARLAEADQRTGRNTAENAEAELTAQREAEQAEAGRGNAA
jgi:hypothetical protein